MWNDFSKKTYRTASSLSLLLILSLIGSAGSVDTLYAQTTETDPVVEQPGELVSASDQTFEPETLINTGATGAITETYTTENTNEIATDSPNNNATSSDPEPVTAATDLASSTDPLATSSDPLVTSTNLGSTTIDILNQATTTTQATTSASTGNNSVTSASGTAAIVTGDAYAYANIVNLTNTNIINSTGFIAFLNQLFGQSTVDITDMFDVFSGDTAMSTCAIAGCESGQFETFITNSASIENDITVLADTGNNTASAEQALISTGNAYAVANVTNIANTNIIDANYLMLSFSNFGDLIGDVILPGAHLLEKLFSGGGGSTVLDDTVITSNAVVSNTISTNATTGDNSSASGTANGVQTGNATSYSNVFNQINTTAINADSFTLLFRVQGDWDGEIFGLPEGLSYTKTASGILITNDNGNQGTGAEQHAINANLISTTEIVNNVTVEATTGNNTVTGEADSYIETGEAYAAANVTNIANTNILGRNWGLLIFDIFGDWQGDISFGQPDLWIGGIANAVDGHTRAGAAIEYTFTISNLGDSVASNVLLNGTLNSDLISLQEPVENILLGTIAPGDTIEKTFNATVADTLPSGSHPVDLEVTLSSEVPDKSLTNNSEVVTVLTENIRQYGSGRSRTKYSSATSEGDILIEKRASQSHAIPGDTVGYEVTMTNFGGPVYGATLVDTLYDSTGTTTAERSWQLTTFASEETITVTYDVQFSATTTLGTHLNRAFVRGYHKNSDEQFAETYNSMVATVPVVLTNAVPLVLGIATTTEVCEPYLTSYLKRGNTNKENQVRRLQVFINDFTDTSLDVTGLFDLATEQAVRQFQLQHKVDVLDPWGLSHATGHVYYTTQKKINELYCAEAVAFPLSPLQVAEVTRYRLGGGTKSNSIVIQTETPQPITTPRASVLLVEPLNIKLTDKDDRPQTTTLLPNKIDTTLRLNGPKADRSLFTKFVGWIKERSLSHIWTWRSVTASE